MFFDDIFIYSSHITNHATHLNKVFEILLEHQLVINKKKCSFAVFSVEYLGHILANGMAVDLGKTKAMLEWQVPLNQKALRGFLGLTNIIVDLSKVMGALLDLYLI